MVAYPGNTTNKIYLVMHHLRGPSATTTTPVVMRSDLGAVCFYDTSWVPQALSLSYRSHCRNCSEVTRLSSSSQSTSQNTNLHHCVFRGQQVAESLLISSSHIRSKDYRCCASDLQAAFGWVLILVSRTPVPIPRRLRIPWSWAVVRWGLR